MPEPIAGLEFAGEVSAVGPGVNGVAVGDRVMGMGAGGFAEYVAVDHRLLTPVPERLSWEEAATFPLVFQTAHDALVSNGRLVTGERVLIHAVSSGVGIAALQIARLLGARAVFGTSGSAAKLGALRDLGLDSGIDTTAEDFAEVVRVATDGAGVDVVIDNVGGPYLAGNLRCMAHKGRLVSVGRLGGGAGELDLNAVAAKRLSIIGVTFRTRTLDERVAVARHCADDLLFALTTGRIRPVVDRVYPLGQVMEAQAYLAQNQHIGKIAIAV
ncbi:MAG: zinc-binding dehydrogenase [Dehalococcoidia bacterium]